MGGRFGGVRFIKAWPDYFPHVPPEALRTNFHKQLDALQGKRRTYMVGEVFNLPLVSECVDFARYLIRRSFRSASGESAAPGSERPGGVLNRPGGMVGTSRRPQRA